MPLARASSTLFGMYGWPRSSMFPESCFWKPLMILISVDLPAPLSPSRPSTSPFFRCRLTSRSAVTGPKRLAMCSTRRTSSVADAGATTSGASAGGMTPGGSVGSTTAGLPPGGAAHVDVCSHRHDHREARVEEQVVGVDALQDQPVLEDPEEQRADQRADDRARAARQE